MLLSHLTCRSPAVKGDLSARMTGTVWFGGWEEGVVKVSEPSAFGGARASDVTSVGSRQLSGRKWESDHMFMNRSSTTGTILEQIYRKS